MKPTAKQIELSKQAYDAGVRVEPYITMWVIIPHVEWAGNVGDTSKLGFCLRVFEDGSEDLDIVIPEDNIGTFKTMEEIIPILDFETAVEWLRNNMDMLGYSIIEVPTGQDEYKDIKEKFLCAVELVSDDIEEYFGNTDTEAILSCVLEVAKKIKGGNND